MKKKLLFVIESLVCAGAEKSLATLLNLIDYSRYDVDLQLFAYGGEFEALLPPEVNLLPPLKYFSFTYDSLISTCKHCHTADERKMLFSRLRYSLSLRTGNYTHPQKAVLFWKHTHHCFDIAKKQYDIAIAYAQGTPTFYVAECVHATKKYAWINAIYRPTARCRDYISAHYQCFDSIVCVSDAAQSTFNEVFPEYAHKSTVIYDINDGRFISRMAEMSEDVLTDMNTNALKILTVGRLAPQKGYDIALDACRLLNERGINFKWYVLGRGALESDIKARIAENHLEDTFILLGTRANPYPYYKQADIYVQTSRFEGFGLAIAEARMLNTPVVTTCFDAVDAQMIDGENGLVVDMSPEAVADGIERLIQDKALYEHIREYQSRERKGNEEEIKKFYQLIEG